MCDVCTNRRNILSAQNSQAHETAATVVHTEAHISGSSSSSPRPGDIAVYVYTTPGLAITGLFK